VAVDLTDDDAPARVRDHVLDRHGRLTLLVNNAGASWRATFAEGGYANIRRTMDVNFDAVVRLTEALLPALRASAPSAIVNVSSTSGRIARPRAGPTRPASSRWPVGATPSTPRSARTASTSASCCPAT
jgi:short-subunit dehydrogenase